METFLIRALQLILSLSILVFLHEFGHFFFARVFKVRVDKFYMFFNPNFSLVRAKKINGQWQVRFFAKNVPANERPKRDADGDIMLDSKGRQLVEPIPVNELEDNDWRKYPDNTEWGIGWLPLGGYCKIAGMVDESMDAAQMNKLLLDYNSADARNLESLLVKAYNMKLKDTPFYESNKIM